MSAQVDVGPTPAEEKLDRALLDSIARVHPLALMVDAQGCVAWLSDGFAKLCPEGGSVIGRALRDALPKLPNPEQSFEMLRQLSENGCVVGAPIDLVDPTNSRRPLEISMLPLDADDEPGAFQLVIARDRNDEEALGHDHSILLSLPDAVLCVDATGFLNYANPAAEDLFGRARDSLMGAPAALLAQNMAQLKELMLALCNAAPSRISLGLRTGSGSILPLAAAIGPHRREDGAAQSVISLRDDSEHRAVEAEHERRNDQLEHCVATLAHDLRSPLVALLGFSRLLRQDYGDRLDATGAHFVDRIEQAGRTMEALIHDLLELSRIGHPGEHPTLVDSRAVLMQLAAELKPRLDAARIELEIPEDPPLVYFDRTRLYQVFSNLIGNAIEHMREPGDAADAPVAHIRVTVAEEPTCHRLSVTDDGRGIDPCHHEKIFEVFHSLERRRDGTRGTGMGLAIVRKIAVTHGGSASVDSEPGRGSSFHVTLPRE